MSERIKVPIPQSTFPTRIEVYYKDELNRSGGVQPGATETSVKIPADIDECEIRIIPCDHQGKPTSRGYLYSDGKLVARPPESMAPPKEEPVAEEPVAEEPVAEEPVAEEPVAEEPVAEEPVAEEPVAEEPVAEEPECSEPECSEPECSEPECSEIDTDCSTDVDVERKSEW